METRHRVKYWLELAEYDLETAEAMLQTKRYLYVGFMCHQVIEKALKAFYVSTNNEAPPFTHNLAYLAKQSKIIDHFTENQLSILDTLEPLNIETRYPTEKEKILKAMTEERCNHMILKTRELFVWIKKRL